MGILSRLFRTSDTKATNTYMITDAPEMPVTDRASTMTFRPEQITVEYRDGRFHMMEISGPTNGHPNYNTIRKFDRERDVPTWACSYLGDDT